MIDDGDDDGLRPPRRRRPRRVLLFYLLTVLAAISYDLIRTRVATGATLQSRPALASAATIQHRNRSLPSATSLLDAPAPFSDADVFRLAPNLTTSPNTIVSAYFRASSKYSAEHYNEWMRNFLSLQDHMVIFTHEEMFAAIAAGRAHAPERTVIVRMRLEDLPFARLYDAAFWEDQLRRDPERDVHKSYQLFWIWLSKSWWVNAAIELDFFDSDLFVWSDLGSFRGWSRPYVGRTLIRHREVVPRHEMLQMAFQAPRPPPETRVFADKVRYAAHFYHSGMHAAAYAATWRRFHPRFLATVDRFLEGDLPLCDDQVVLQSTCLRHPALCAYVRSEEVDDRRYRALRYVLHYGGTYRLWRYNATDVRDGEARDLTIAADESR